MQKTVGTSKSCRRSGAMNANLRECLMRACVGVAANARLRRVGFSLTWWANQTPPTVLVLPPSLLCSATLPSLPFTSHACICHRTYRNPSRAGALLVVPPLHRAALSTVAGPLAKYLRYINPLSARLPRRSPSDPPSSSIAHLPTVNKAIHYHYRCISPRSQPYNQPHHVRPRDSQQHAQA